MWFESFFHVLLVPESIADSTGKNSVLDLGSNSRQKQQSILGFPVCTKPSLTSVSRRPDKHSSYVTFMPVKSNEMSILGKNQHSSFFGRLGIGEPEHLHMR